MRVETVGNATLYLGEAEEALQDIASVDALITDPPYGIGEAGANQVRKAPWRGGLAAATVWEPSQWDDGPVPQSLLDAAIAKARWSIVFGGNYYRLAPSSCWLVWDKEINGDFADCELAWTNLRKAVRRIRYQWNGMIRANDEPRGEHPTQKPLQVMEWAIQQLPEGCSTILDPFMGSGTTGVAAVAMGLKFIGVERETRYFDAACRRIQHHQQRLFA